MPRVHVVPKGTMPPARILPAWAQLGDGSINRPSKGGHAPVAFRTRNADWVTANRHAHSDGTPRATRAEWYAVQAWGEGRDAKVPTMADPV